MRILMAAMNYAPETVGAGRYTTQLAEHLARQGHEVRVVAAPPYFPAWLVPTGYRRFRYAVKNMNGVEVVRCPAMTCNNPKALVRLLHDASFTASAAAFLLGRTHDAPHAVVAVAPSILSALPALVAAKRARARSILYVQDLESLAAERVGLMPSWAARAGRRLEHRIMRGFDSVVAVSGEMAAALGGETGLGNVRVVRNWADIGVNGRKPDVLAEQLLGEHSRKTVVLYAGSLGRKQGLEILVDAARLVRDSETVVVICGEGPALAGLQIRAYGMQNVLFLPLQDEERFEALMNRADIHVIAQQKDAKGAFMPSKLANICACGGALVCVSGEDGELAGLARAAGGRIVRPGDSRMLASIVRHLAAESEIRLRMGYKAQALAKSCFDKSRALSELEALILPEP